MSCRRAFEIDLAAFLHEPRDARWDDFRAHYPRCAACAAEVAAWTALETMLAPPHPGEETLLCWARERDALDAATRASVERHLARCPSCTEELRVLERFAAGPKEGAGHELRRHEAGVRPAGRRVDHAATRGATATSHAQGRPRRGAPGVLRRVLRHPALPWAALVVLLLLPTFRERFEDTGGPPPRLEAERRPVSAPGAGSPAAQTAARRLDDEGRSADVRDAQPAAEPQLEQPREERALRADERPTSYGTGAVPEPAEPRAASEPAPLSRAPARPPLRSPQDVRDRTAGGGDVASIRAARKQRELAQPAVPDAERDAGMRLGAPHAGGRRTLVVELPEAVRGAGSLEVRVRDATGARELRERVTPAPQARSLSLDVPAAWLDSARYTVEVVAPDGAVVVRGVVSPP